MNIHKIFSGGKPIDFKRLAAFLMERKEQYE